MKKVLDVARGGWGRVNPNPYVGALIVKEGRVVACGYHELLGCAHAEIAALNNRTGDVADGTLYVNLEPCSHYGRTPPCANAIIEAGISRVVVAMEDPNPKVSGRGLQMLREAGIKVTVGVLGEEAKRLNEIFIKYITQKRPFVVLKSATTLDGKIATKLQDSKWITGEASREYVHQLRSKLSSVMVGINTVLCDNPMLNVRLADYEGRQPVRIVIDSKGRIPLDSKLVQTARDIPCVVATTRQMTKEKKNQLEECNVDVIVVGLDKGHVDLCELMEKLIEREIDSVLLEGGGNLNAAAIQSGIVDKVMFFIAPKIIGGYSALSPIEGEGLSWMREAWTVRDLEITRFGEDILVEGYL